MVVVKATIRVLSRGSTAYWVVLLVASQTSDRPQFDQAVGIEVCALFNFAIFLVLKSDGEASGVSVWEDDTTSFFYFSAHSFFSTCFGHKNSFLYLKVLWIMVNYFSWTSEGLALTVSSEAPGATVGAT